ncbi:unnamed protein product [Dibothriocephalus latus]|uniref:BTB domain-containing protein n=1 Tax=Dibothriocephalus latus TaxID=60516 RepID=A0A3P7LM70_DIBLA|nr:unnamed protein product [Dibothriocephalus latus]
MFCTYRETFFDEILMKDACTEFSQLQREIVLVDLTLKTHNDLLVKVHRVVFAARLPKLQDCICSSTDSTLDWSRFSQSSVKALTEYVYTGRLEVSTRTVQPIYLLAASVELEHVRRWCEQFMVQRGFDGAQDVLYE